MLYGTTEYTCPDCGQVCDIQALEYPVAGSLWMVCPHCGVIQNNHFNINTDNNKED